MRGRGQRLMKTSDNALSTVSRDVTRSLASEDGMTVWCLSDDAENSWGTAGARTGQPRHNVLCGFQASPLPKYNFAIGTSRRVFSGASARAKTLVQEALFSAPGD